jgi:hypothetical protein
MESDLLAIIHFHRRSFYLFFPQTYSCPPATMHYIAVRLVNYAVQLNRYQASTCECSLEHLTLDRDDFALNFCAVFMKSTD